LIAQLVTANKALYEEKVPRSTIDRSLAEEKAARQTAEQSFRAADEGKANFVWNLESAEASLTTTTNKLASKSSTPDHAVVWEQKMEIQVKAAEEKLKAVEDKLKAAKEKMKTQGWLLDLAQHALPKWELSS
jgi:hypothetical protein